MGPRVERQGIACCPIAALARRSMVRLQPGTIKKLLGHDSVEQTMDYIACGPPDWREAYDRCRLLADPSKKSHFPQGSASKKALEPGC